MQQYRPENALKRAEELIQQKAHMRALNTLHEALVNKKARMWTVVLEDVMQRHLKLCVDFKKDSFAKEGLLQFRYVCQKVNVASLEKVVYHFLEYAEQRVEAARGKSEAAAEELDKAMDLEQGDASAEGLMLLAVSGVSIQDRTNREILTPWVRFLWQCYRICLDVTKQNPKLEPIFHETAKRGFAFCLKYRRRAEFRRLSEQMRIYFSSHTGSNRPAEQRAELLANVDAFHRMIEARFKQLTVAVELDVWHEAFRSIEDVHSVITHFKRFPAPRLMSSYYEKLAKVFWVSRYHLFHAYSTLKHFNTVTASSKLKKDLTEEGLTNLASRVVLSCVCVPFWENRNNSRNKEEAFQNNTDREKCTRIVRLLGSSVVPTRKSLLTSLLGSDLVTKYMHPELKGLVGIIENTFDPINMCALLQPIANFAEGNAELAEYAPLLRKIGAVRMVEQMSRTYECISLESFCEMCPYYGETEAEELLLHVAGSESFEGQITMCHHGRCIYFRPKDLTCDVLCGSMTHSNRTLKPLLRKCKADRPAAPRKVLDAATVFERVEAERQEVLRRRQVIEDRRQAQEEWEAEIDRLAREKKAKEQLERKENEQERMATEKKIREEQKAKRLKQEEEKQQGLKLIEKVSEQLGDTKANKLVKDAKAKDEMVDIARKLLLEKNLSKEKRLNSDAKKLDYFERACRDDEAALLKKFWAEDNKKSEAEMAEKMASALQADKERWEKRLETKNRLSRMEGDWENFRKGMMARREALNAGGDEGEWAEV